MRSFMKETVLNVTNLAKWVVFVIKIVVHVWTHLVKYVKPMIHVNHVLLLLI